MTAYALVFQGVYGWSPGVAGLAYFGMIAGEIIAFMVVVFQNPRYVKKLKANNNIPVPEWRLPVAMVGGVLFSGGLFWVRTRGISMWEATKANRYYSLVGLAIPATSTGSSPF